MPGSCSTSQLRLLQDSSAHQTGPVLGRKSLHLPVYEFISSGLAREFCPYPTGRIMKLTSKMRNDMGFLKVTCFNVSWIFCMRNFPSKRRGHFIPAFGFKNPLDKALVFLPQRLWKPRKVVKKTGDADGGGLVSILPLLCNIRQYPSPP